MASTSSTSNLTFKQFYGLDLSRDPAYLASGYSPDALNIDTSYGNLSVRAAAQPFFYPDLDCLGDIDQSFVLQAYGSTYLVFSTRSARAGDPGIYICTDALPDGDAQADDGSRAPTSVFKLWTLNRSAATQPAHFRIGSVQTAQISDAAGVAQSALLFSVWTCDAQNEMTYDQAGLYKFILSRDPGDYQAATPVVAAPSEQTDTTMEEYYLGRRITHFTMAFGRLFAVCGAPKAQSGGNRVFYSRVAEYDRWQNVVDDELSGGYVDIGQDDGGSIVDIRNLYSEIVIYKTNGVYKLTGDRPSNFQILRIDDGLRCLSAECNCATKLGFLTLCDGGLYAYNGNSMEYLSQSDALRPLWSVLQNMEYDLSIAGAQPPRLCFHHNTLYIYFTENHPIYEYDIQRGVFMASAYQGVNTAGLLSYKGRLLAPSAGGYVRLLDGQLAEDSVYAYDETNALGIRPRPIRAHWQTPDMDLYRKDVRKMPETLYLFGYGANAADTQESFLPYLYVRAEAKDRRGRYKQKVRTVDAGATPGMRPTHLRLRLRTRGRTLTLRFENANQAQARSASSFFSLSAGANMRLELDGD